MRALIPTTLTLIAQPALEPLDLAEVKNNLRFSSTSQDTLLDVSVSAARQHFEEQTGRQVMEATYELWLDAFPLGRIELPKPPLLEVESVSYIGSDGVLTVMDSADYTVKAPAGPYASPGWVQTVFGASWPTAQDEPCAVRVRFKAGYGSAPGDVPELIRRLLHLLVGHFFQYRSETIETKFDSALSTLPLGAEAFIRGYKYTALPKHPPRYADWRVVA